MMLSVTHYFFMLSVIMPNVIMLSVVAPTVDYENANLDSLGDLHFKFCKLSFAALTGKDPL